MLTLFLEILLKARSLYITIVMEHVYFVGATVKNTLFMDTSVTEHIVLMDTSVTEDVI